MVRRKTQNWSRFFSIVRSRPASDTATLGAPTSNSGPVVTSKTTYETTTTGTPPPDPADPEHKVERAPIWRIVILIRHGPKPWLQFFKRKDTIIVKYTYISTRKSLIFDVATVNSGWPLDRNAGKSVILFLHFMKVYSTCYIECFNVILNFYFIQ